MAFTANLLYLSNLGLKKAKGFPCIAYLTQPEVTRALFFFNLLLTSEGSEQGIDRETVEK
jgi:hypothetical protein